MNDYHFYCVVIGRWPGGRSVLLFACVLVHLHLNVGGFSFKINFLVPLHFPLQFFCQYFFFYSQKSLHFSLTFLLFCVLLWRFCPWSYTLLLFCYFFALPFMHSLGIETNLWQLFLLFLFVSSPVPQSLMDLSVPRCVWSNTGVVRAEVSKLQSRCPPRATWQANRFK